MRIHVLKTWSPYFEATKEGSKPWEMRFDDRGYQVDDFLVLRHFIPVDLRDPLGNPKHPTGRWGEEYVVMRVKAVFTGFASPVIPDGFVVMTLADVSDQEFVEVMGRVTTDNEGGIWSGVGALGVR